MPINSRTKGANGEREWSHFCHDHGFLNVRRTQQFCGNTGDASDCVGLDGVHIEVKRNEHLNVHDAINQAVRDATASSKDVLPMVAHRKNRTEWLVTMRAADWFILYKAWLLTRKDDNESISKKTEEND